MPLIYITGPTGSGKSTIATQLDSMGYEVYDTDKDGIRYWLNEAGEPVKVFQKGETQPREWLNNHKLGLPMSWLTQLKIKSSRKPVFVCGTSPIDHYNADIWDKLSSLRLASQ